jgi:bacterioferritin-associated ferredoxin
MIICSCNVLTDYEVRYAISTGAPRSAAHVHRCLGCSAQCGRCMRTICHIMGETLAAARQGCPTDYACCQQKKI